MPWCEPCGRFLNPNSAPDQRCPTCGGPLETGPDGGRRADETRPRAPWHSWVGVFAVTAYLGWRLVQGVIALFGGVGL